eukprot:sb/3477209/
MGQGIKEALEISSMMFRVTTRIFSQFLIIMFDLRKRPGYKTASYDMHNNVSANVGLVKCRPNILLAGVKEALNWLDAIGDYNGSDTSGWIIDQTVFWANDYAATEDYNFK